VSTPSPSPTRAAKRRRTPRSPLQAVLLAALVLAVVLAGTWASGAFGGDRPPAPSAPVTATGSAPAPDAPVFAEPPAEPVPPAAVAAAQAWTAAFCVQPGTPRDAWLDRLRPLTDPEYLGQLATDSDPASAPQKVTGPAAAVSGAAGSAVVDVPTDLGVLRLSLVAGTADGDTSGAWLVSDADPAGAGR
jgi:hypothetical protein